MIVTESFVFLHNLRTGGTFLRYVLRDNGVRFRKFDEKHTAWKQLDNDKDRAKPVIIFVRNPWEWAVSLYSFEQQYIPGQNAWACGTFEEVVMGKTGAPTNMASHQEYFEHFTDGVPPNQLLVGRYEHLREDAERLFKQAKCPNFNKIQRALRNRPKVHNSLHAPYRDYYTPELRDYVRDQNARLIERFGYSF
jgi:hypothetical protein